MSSDKIKKNINEIKSWAQKNVILNASEKNDFIKWCDKLEKNFFQASQTPLKIGLLGGTGVGKSTIINRLAGEEISVAHKYRPQTNNVIVYQHQDFSSDVNDETPYTVICKHTRSEISHLILYDFPDYDSLISDHRETVLKFSKELDIIVWVTSPEKYADQSMIQMMKTLLQSSKNYCFVLNKIDQLTYEETDQVVGHWNMLLGQIEIFGAPIFAISALLSSDDINKHDRSRDSFLALQKWIFKKRKEHERIVIAKSNIEKQIDRRVKTLCQKIDCQKYENIVHELEKISSDLKTFEKNRQKDILEILTPDAHLSILNYLKNQSHFLWPVRIAFSFFHKLNDISDQNEKRFFSTKSPELFLKNIDQKINILNLKPVNFENDISLRQTYSDFIDQYQDPNQVAPFLGKIGTVQSLLFIAKQWFAMTIPLLICILYLGNISSISLSFTDINFNCIISFAFNVLLRLFHSDGFIAMLSLFVIEIFICIKLASSWHKKMNDKARLLYKHLSCNISKTLLQTMLSQLQPLIKWSQQAHLDCITLIDYWDIKAKKE